MSYECKGLCFTTNAVQSGVDMCSITHSVKVVIVTSAKEYMFLSFVCPLATLHKNFQTDLHEIFKEGWQCANEELIKFR